MTGDSKTRIWKTLAAGMILCATAMSGVKADASELSGTWRWKAPVSSEKEGVIVLKLNQDGESITGALRSEAREGIVKIREGKVKDSKISFTINTRFDDQVITVHYDGEIKRNRISGVYSVPAFDVESEWNARKKPVKSETAVIDPVGTWKWTYNSGGTERVATMEISGKPDSYKGRISAGGQFAAINKISVKGNEITLDAEMEFNGGTLKSKYVAIVDEDLMEGNQSHRMGDNAFDASWNAEKQPIEIDGDWQWSIDTPNGNSFEGDLELKQGEDGKLTGTLSTANWNTPIKEGRVDGRTISYKTTNQEETMTFETSGILEDGKIQGKVSFDYQGNQTSLNWNARRKN